MRPSDEQLAAAMWGVGKGFVLHAEDRKALDRVRALFAPSAEQLSDLGHKLRKTVLALHDIDQKFKVIDEQRKALFAERKKICDTCPHIWTHIPDASGNDDSYDTCEICGLTKCGSYNIAF